MALVYIASNRRTRLVRITVWAAIIGLLLGVLSSLAMAVSADAHAALTSISPADGAQLAQAPTQVVLTFDEAISTSFATVTVTNPDGASVSQGRAQVDGAVVTQALAAGLGAGRYTVAFRVVSDDGHPVSDRTTFTVLPSATATGSPSDPATATPDASPSGAAAAGPQAADPSSGNSQQMRLGLAVGVGALALAAGTALVALSRRRRAS
jgi:methionine-rich copper-binding protein CopC